MASSSVVVLKPRRKCSSLISIGEGALRLGILVLQGTVEALDLDVLPGTLRLDAPLPDAAAPTEIPQ